jgi:hypothetical protein
MLADKPFRKFRIIPKAHAHATIDSNFVVKIPTPARSNHLRLPGHRNNLVRNLLSRLRSLSSSLMPSGRIWIEERSNCDDHVHKHAQHAFEVIGLAVAEEIADDEDGQDEYDGIENLEVEVHAVAEAPTYDDDEGRVEERSLDRCAEDVGQREVHLIVPGFIYGGDVFGGFLDEGDKDEAKEAADGLVQYFNGVAGMLLTRP